MTWRDETAYRKYTAEREIVVLPEENIAGLQDFDRLPASYRALVSKILRDVDFAGSHVILGTGRGSRDYILAEVER